MLEEEKGTETVVGGGEVDCQLRSIIGTLHWNPHSPLKKTLEMSWVNLATLGVSKEMNCERSDSNSCLLLNPT